MSAVNVLGVLDELVADMGNTPGTTGQQVEQVRAAVAELIEAIKPLAALDLRPDGFDKRDDSQPVYARDKTVITVGDVRRASAALANCRGGES